MTEHSTYRIQIDFHDVWLASATRAEAARELRHWRAIARKNGALLTFDKNFLFDRAGA